MLKPLTPADWDEFQREARKRDRRELRNEIQEISKPVTQDEGNVSRFKSTPIQSLKNRFTDRGFSSFSNTLMCYELQITRDGGFCAVGCQGDEQIKYLIVPVNCVSCYENVTWGRECATPSVFYLRSDPPIRAGQTRYITLAGLVLHFTTSFLHGRHLANLTISCNVSTHSSTRYYTSDY